MVAPTAFPSVEGLQISKDGSEYVYGGSIALNRILGRMRDLAPTGSYPFRLWLINTYTLFENVHTLDATLRTTSEAFHAEVNILLQYIEAYAASLPGKHRIPEVVFYHPTYTLIPDKRRREVKEGTKSGKARMQLDTLYQKFIRSEMAPGPVHLPRPNGLSSMWSVPVGRGSFPHRELSRWLQQSAPQLTYTSGEAVALITHCPMDLHIHRYVPGLIVFERYTGELLGTKDFGKKIDSTGTVPFNMYTHQVFGDKVHLKPLITPKQKRELLAIAEKRKWHHRSQQDIFNDIKTLTGLKSEDAALKL